MANKTLVILTPGFAADESDTTCLPFLQNHIRAFNKYYPGLEIIIIAFQYPYVKGIYKWNNNEVISFGGRSRGKIYRQLLWLKVWRKLRELKRSKQIIGLFSLWCTEAALVGSYFGKFNGLKHYTWICGQDARSSNTYVKYIRPAAKELVAMSDFLKSEFYRGHGIEPGHVILKGLDETLFSGQQQERTIDILGAGSLIPLKQYDVFIEVVRRLVSVFPTLNVAICGKGPEENKLHAMIASLGLQNNISLLGEVPHRQVLELMERSRVLLHTSSYEGFSEVCLEALYAGAHVVSFTRAMDVEIEHWHCVGSKEEMIAAVGKILGSDTIVYSSVAVNPISDTVRQMMSLFTGQ